jgi:hypothetical protein
VINLFNGAIPLVAIQMNAFKIGEHLSLIFTTVMNQLNLSLVDEDEEVQEVTNRDYWEHLGTKETPSKVGSSAIRCCTHFSESSGSLLRLIFSGLM